MFGPEDQHVMLDIETLSDEPDAAILSYGAVRFTIDGFPAYQFRRELYRVIDLDDALKHKGKVSGRTFYWWMNQSAKARAAICHEHKDTLHQAMNDLHLFIHKDDYVWSHGSNFDQPIVHGSMRNVGMWVPWNYRRTRDTRTFYDVCAALGVQFKKEQNEEDKHHPLFDAYRQAKHVQQGLRFLREVKNGLRGIPESTPVEQVPHSH